MKNFYSPFNAMMHSTKAIKKIIFVLCIFLFLFLSSNPVFAVLKTSAGTGNWGTAATWSPVGIPAAGDDVVIAAGHTVTINVSTTTLLSLIIDGTLVYNSTNNRTVTVNGNVTVNGTFTVADATAANNHSLLIQGDLDVSGVLSLDANVVNADFCRVNFNGNNALQNVTGAGVISFNTITVNKGVLRSNTLDIQSVISMTDGGLTITNGTFKLSSASSITPYIANATIPVNAGFWNNGGTVTTTGGNITVTGLLRNSSGDFNLGNTVNNSISATNLNSNIIMEGGNLTIAGRLRMSNGDYTQTNGTVVVCDLGNTSALASFEFRGAGDFTMSGGTILLRQEAITTDYYNTATGTTTITGGLLQIGDAVTVIGATFNIRGSMPALTIDASVNTKQVYTVNPIFVFGDLNIQTGSELNCNTFAGTGYLTSFYGATINNDGSIIGTGANSKFGFYGSVAQSYSGAGTFGTAISPFGNLGIEILNSNNVTLNAPVYSLRFNLVNGSFINSNQITIGNGLTGTVQVGGGGVGLDAGTFDSYPVLNTGNSYTIRYESANAITTGLEVPASRTATTVLSNNPTGTTLSGGDMIVNSLQLLQGSYDIVANSLIIKAAITQAGGNINAASGTVEMNGTSNQTIPANTFLNDDLLNIIITNTAGGTTQVTLGGVVNLYGDLSFGNVNNKRFRSLGFLTLKSNATATARVADLTNGGVNIGNTIVGDVTMERYLLNGRKWRLLAAPTNNATQTISSSWQENYINVPGYGFNAADTRADYAARGFDLPGGNTSVKLFNGVTSNWDAVDNTNVTPINSERGYIAFVAGDRSITFPGSNATTFRTTGTLNMGTQALINVTANQFMLIGNPYPSRIDMRNISTTNLANTFYLWDPAISTLGGVNTFYYDVPSSNFKNLLPSSTYGAAGTNNNYIESGIAFLVSAGAIPGTLTFQENDKTTGSAVSNFTANDPQALNVNLYMSPQNGNPALLVDGMMVNFDSAYTNALDINDIKKLNSFGENVGLKTANTVLAIERRFAVSNDDTLYINIANMQQQNYQWQLLMNNMDFPGRAAFLLDAYLQTSTVLDMTAATTIDFQVNNNPASAAADRFKIVFKQLGTVPVSITTVAAGRNADRTISVLWKTENELNISSYEIERSADGNNFTGLFTKTVITGNVSTATYNHKDLQPLMGDNFYRIKAISVGGQIQYSAIVKVSALKQAGNISVYPNPVVDGQLQLRFIGQATGKYQVQLSNASGQVLYNGSIMVNNAVQSQTIVLPSKATAGAYQLKVISADGTVNVQQLLVK